MSNNEHPNSRLNEWNDIKIFRDPVHQYIEIPKAYVNHIIDTYEMQRIKDVAQSGLRSVFNAATHDRFSHSLGVYYLGRKAFKSLKKNILNIVNKESFLMSSGTRKNIKDVEGLDIEKKLGLWEVLFYTACILHDIGHPAMSHTLEFLYDDFYMDLDSTKEEPISVSQDEYERYIDLRKELMENTDPNVAANKFKTQLGEKLLESECAQVKGNPHERMSAFYILQGLVVEKDSVTEKKTIDIKPDSLAEQIKNLIESYYENNGVGNESYDIEDCLSFICRMIIGQPYDTAINCDDDINECFLNSIKNAIIALLNSTIDADSLDYISRNSYSAGYDTNSIDVNRMCTAYSVRLLNNVLEPVFEKNALSVLEGFISARNYEPMWLYSHHKIVYNIDVLYKCLFKCAVEMLYQHDIDAWSKIILDNFMERKRSKGRLPISNCNFYKRYIKKIDCPCEKCEQENCFNCKKCLNDQKHFKTFDVDDVDRLEEIIGEMVTKVAKDKYFDMDIFIKNLHPNSDDSVRQQIAQIHSIINKGTGLLNDDKTDFSAYIKTLLGNIREYVDNYSAAEKKLFNYAKQCKDKSPCDNFVSRFYENLKDFLLVRSENIQKSSLKSIIIKTRKYLYDLIQNGVPAELEKRSNEFISFIECLYNRYSELIDIRNLYFSYILSPVRGFDNGKYVFERSNDSDIDALFKRLYVYVKNKQTSLTNIEKTYYDLAKEYFNRRYKRSLWKSHQEYKVFLDPISKETHIPVDEINRYFIELIRRGGQAIVFHNDNLAGANGDFENQKVYSCHREGDLFNSDSDIAYQREFNELVSDFRDSFIIRIHSIKYKDFGKSVKVAFKQNIFRLSEIIDIPKSHNEEFPYVFVGITQGKNNDGEGECKRDNLGAPAETLALYRENLQKKLTQYCVRKHSGAFINERSGDNFMTTNSGKIFRDVVHGDIEIPKKFLSLIDTKAFQRLRRIKQLSTADLVFPNAAHTRFSHCIGTFYIMTLIVEHFKGIFQNLGVAYSDQDIDALLTAALLHDIGHGPYSHNFERLHSEESHGDIKSHEEWGVDIIENDLEIQNAIKSSFPSYEIDGFIRLIKSYIVGDMNDDNKQLSFHMIFKSLISSQLDADRFDYLLRDSFNTGIGYGNIDVHSIIHGMRITEYQNKFYVCISENTVSYVEQFLFGRYKMYDSVYYNAYKVFSETLVIKILKYIQTNKDKFESVDKNIMDMINNKLDVKKYITLDDSYINGLFTKWQESDDVILRTMCSALLNRKGYKRIYALNQTFKDFVNFKNNLRKLFKQYFPDWDMDIMSLNSFIFADRRFCAYRYIPETDTASNEYISKILVLTNDGLLKDFAEVSPMFYTNNSKKWDTYKCYIYYNKELLKYELENMANKPDDFENKKSELLVNIDRLIQNFNLRNHIEIEEKYTCTLKEIEKVKRELGCEETKQWNDIYLVKGGNGDLIHQIDVYYDTDDMILARKNCSLRCRSKQNDQYKVTIKIPTPGGGFDQESQVARFEYELNIQDDNLIEAFDFICTTLRDVIPDKIDGLTKDNFHNIFKQVLTVTNNRKKYFISSSDCGEFKFVVCVDDISFMHGKKEKKDYQIEVELESDYIHRVSMKFFTDKLEKLLKSPIKHEKSSKYEKGLKIFKLLDDKII